jgi:hypothetical protein
MNSLTDLNFTYHLDKYSCIRQMYFIHIFFSYLVSISGFLAIITRFIPRFKYIHHWLGKTYIISMLWCTSTSILIHNTGLPLAVLITFIWVLLGLCIGWTSITIHQLKLKDILLFNIDQKIKNSININVFDLKEQFVKEKRKIIQNKTPLQIFFSYKTLHGICMISSWICIVGRLFFSNQSGDFTCHTYPSYKAGYLQYTNMTIVPIHDPDFERLPWSYSPTLWGLLVIGGSIVSTTALALMGSFWTMCKY